MKQTQRILLFACMLMLLQTPLVHAQLTTVASKHLANLDVQMASFQRAQTVDKLSDALIIESINKIQARRIEDWPSF